MTLTDKELNKAVKGFNEHFKKKYPPKNPKDRPRKSRFDYMTPEQLQFWEEEHQ